MFPIDPNAPGGPDRSDSLQRSYLDHTPVRARLPTLTISQQIGLRISCCVLSGRPKATARQPETTRGAEPITRAAVNGVALSRRADRSPSGSQSAVEA
jgi:hypothetical protein